MRVHGFALSFLVVGLTSCAPLRHASVSAPSPSLAKQRAPAREDKDAESPGDAAKAFITRRWQGPGKFPSERYLVAKQKVRKFPVRGWGQGGAMESAASTPSLSPWQPLGPGNIGGRVRGIAIDPTNPNTIYAGSATGGVWKTTDGGQSWASLTDLLPVLTIGSLVMDPTNPQILYAGTGEATGNSNQINDEATGEGVGDGVFKTTNGGTTWTQLAGAATLGGFIPSLAVSPTRPSNIYAATSNGLFVSTDAGNTWTQALSTQQVNEGCNSVVVRGDQPTDIAFAACGSYTIGATSNTFTYSIYRNMDAGGSGTWQVVRSDSNDEQSEALALAPSNPSTIYAITTVYVTGALGAVLQSTGNGDNGTWQVMADASSSGVAANILSGDPCFGGDGQGYYNLAIAVDPTNPNTVFVGGIDLFRSDDGGVTWGFIDPYASTGTAHVDQHIFAFAPGYNGKSNQTLYVGNDGGVYVTSVALEAPNPACGPYGPGRWNSLDNSFATTQFYYGTPVPGGWTYFGGTQDNGTVVGTDPAGINGWNPVFGGDGGQVLVDPLDPNVRFVSLADFLDIEKSSDGFLTLVPAANGIADSEYNWAYYYTFDPSNSLTLYFAGGTRVWRSTDAGNNWVAASATIPSNTLGASVVAVDPNDSNTAYFGANYSGQVYSTSTALTADSTTAWMPVQLRSSKSGFISSISFDPNLPDRVYATVSTFQAIGADAQIYRSDDRGMTWTAIGNGPNQLPDIPVHTLIVDPDLSSTLYIGTDIGVFASFDGGNTWTQGAAPFADAIAYGMQIRKENGVKTLWVFTYGRGVWRLNLSGSASSCTYALSPNAVSAAGDETVGSLQVLTQPGCTWSASPGPLSYLTFATIQSPAIGVGPGPVFYEIPFNTSDASRTDTLYVQGMPVTVTQSAVDSVSHTTVNDTIGFARIVSPLPYGDYLSNPAGYTGSASDPVHSCTGSPDSLNAWWAVSATQAENLIATVRAPAQDFYGDAGVVVTAYPLSGGVLGKELACQAIPQNMNVLTGSGGYPGTPGSITFPVQAGSQYAIEISATTTEAPNAEYLQVAALAQVKVMPTAQSLQAGQQIQFSAAVVAPPNTSTRVRWTVSPPQFGRITPSGLYTAPAAAAQPTQVTVTAASFANPAALGTATVTISPSPGPVINQGGIVPADSSTPIIQPGSWVSIYGSNLAPGTATWNGDFPTSLGGVSVSIDNKSAYLSYVSPTQINLQAPDDTSAGNVNVVVTTPSGTTTSTVSLSQVSPSFLLFSGKYPAAIIPTPNGGGAYGNGTYNLLGPAGAFSFSTQPVQAGQILELYGVGFGPTNPSVPAGQLFSGAAPTVNPVTITIGGVSAKVLFAGIAGAGLYQFNVIVPEVGAGDQLLLATVGGAQTQPNIYVTVQ